MTRRPRFFLAMIPMFFAAAAARADVSWLFIVTEATDLRCPTCHPFPVPVDGGALTMTDAAFFRGGVSYFYESDRDTETINAFGDTDFNLHLGVFPLPLDPSWLSGSTESLFNGQVNIGVSRDGKLSGSVLHNTSIDNIDMGIDNGIVTDARWASDSGIPGCGDFTQCVVSGYWQLTSALPTRVPEPSTTGILAAGIAIFGLLRWRRPFARQARFPCSHP
jgi:hypothetical protein